MNRISWKREWPHWLLLLLMAVLYLSSVPYHTEDELDQVKDEFLQQEGVSRIVTLHIEMYATLLIAALLLYVILLLLPKIDPLKQSYSLFRNVYETFRLTILAVLAGISAILQYADSMPEFSATRALPVILGMGLIVFGNSMGKLRPNWFIGFATPWTISNRVVWTRTNRLGGWLYTIFGILLIPSGFLSAGFAFLFFAAGFLLILLTLTLYSYFIYKNDITDNQ